MKRSEVTTGDISSDNEYCEISGDDAQEEASKEQELKNRSRLRSVSITFAAIGIFGYILAYSRVVPYLIFGPSPSIPSLTVATGGVSLIASLFLLLAGGLAAYAYLQRTVPISVKVRSRPSIDASSAREVDHLDSTIVDDFGNEIPAPFYEYREDAADASALKDKLVERQFEQSPKTSFSGGCKPSAAWQSESSSRDSGFSLWLKRTRFLFTVF